jgi:hypothetical protein
MQWKPGSERLNDLAVGSAMIGGTGALYALLFLLAKCML